ncbi:MAG: bifunctional diaminohydroxyphosphoribosylaminopyrimidine deaminase/5-amino-6-(5-phosphoribosylamino)uracil reductase RibD [Polyangiaceae bacterium]|jgi:diaminohydroxyphosphoribosylaminopyrimidine deaminase / 5-amino-6-(5-phosphoribosylamino)uracil reductase|nr:bifunctional diaminohydroxyphosphoribosylaminopyrimidine deaminase/5-amino-6-(5-phosphoribosylamino)uracil reductase RibD [Polyangiaceae bacterium]
MTTIDEMWMQHAVATAASARRTVSPRPWVGAVLVTRDGRSFAGATQGRDGPHAEDVVLRAAGDAARGATLYVTLEPCSHYGRTPPCADAIVRAGVARCVVAICDNDERVCGRGFEKLRAGGIELEQGVLADEVRAQLAPYLHHRRTGRPYVVLKLAASIDGHTAAPDGSSKWITGPEARLDAHRLRADSDAILVGAGTVRADDPELTVRLPEGEIVGNAPLRVVLGRAPGGAKIQPCLELAGDPEQVLDELGRRGVLQVLIEGGATVAYAFHARGLVNLYVTYLAPALFGGQGGRGLFNGAGAATMSDLWRGQILGVRRVGDDTRIDMIPKATAPVANVVASNVVTSNGVVASSNIAAATE